MAGSTDGNTHVYHHSNVEIASKPKDELVVEKHGTQRDAHDMARMGRVQLRRVTCVLD